MYSLCAHVYLCGNIYICTYTLLFRNSSPVRDFTLMSDIYLQPMFWVFLVELKWFSKCAAMTG